jgi:hypothetical protein
VDSVDKNKVGTFVYSDIRRPFRAGVTFRLGRGDVGSRGTGRMEGDRPKARTGLVPADTSPKEDMMAKSTPHIHDFCEENARTDSGYAIAFAILELADAQKAAAKALDRLGLNYTNETGPPGALEELAMQAKRVADALISMSEEK